jgi:putative oxidoreductase
VRQRDVHGHHLSVTAGVGCGGGVAGASVAVLPSTVALRGAASEESAARRALVALRVGVAGLLFVHGAARAVTGGYVPFGEFLDSQGLPAGVAWATGITAIELLGTPLLAAGRWVTPLCIYFVIQLTIGILMVHLGEGWFVVGLGRNGVEYSVSLILCLGCVAAGSPRRDAHRSASSSNGSRL